MACNGEASAPILYQNLFVEVEATSYGFYGMDMVRESHGQH